MIQQNQKQTSEAFCDKVESEYSEILETDENNNLLYRRKHSVTYTSLISNNLTTSIEPFENVVEGPFLFLILVWSAILYKF